MSYYQLNPLLLEMSTRQLMKKRKLYTPQQWQSMMKRLQALGKNPNSKVTGLHNVDEYGKRMIQGQKLRGKKLARQHGRELYVYKNPWMNNNGSTSIDMDGKTDIIDYSLNPFLNKKQRNYKIGLELYRNNNHSKNGLKRKDIRKLLRDYRKASVPLSQAETLAHEMDEYSLGLNSAKKLGLSQDDFRIAAGRPVSIFYNPEIQSVRSSHLPGVLDREAKRINKLHTLYGKDSLVVHPRDAEEFAKNKKSHVYNHPTSKKIVAAYSNNPVLKQKASKSLESYNNQLQTTSITNAAKAYGYDIKEQSFKQLLKQYHYLIDRDEFREAVDKAAAKRGIKKYIPDPNYSASSSSSIFSNIPDGYMISEEYKNFRRAFEDKWKKRTDALSDYLDMIENNRKKH